MASRGSHKACSRCHTGRIDKRAGHGMCRTCRDEYTRELRASRAAVKQRRAARAEVLPVSEDKPPFGMDKSLAEPDLSPEIVAAEINVGTIAEPERHKGGRGTGLSVEQQDEMVKLYLTTEESPSEIGRAFGVKATYIYQVLKKRGIAWRREMGMPAPAFEPEHRNGVVKPEIVDDVPEDVVKALERMIAMPEVPSRPEPVRAIAVPQQAPAVPSATSLPEYVEQVLPSTVGESVWRIDYEGSVLVNAATPEQALERARADGHIRVINGVTRHTR